MAGRTAFEILRDRERELAGELVSLKEYVATIEAELESIRFAIEALDTKRSSSDRLTIGDDVTAVVIPADRVEQYRKMTINELILDALEFHFTSGASHAQLREAFSNNYGRAIEQSSLRSQLARLKAMGLVATAAASGNVKLTPRGVAQAQNERRQRMLRLQE